MKTTKRLVMVFKTDCDTNVSISVIKTNFTLAFTNILLPPNIYFFRI